MKILIIGAVAAGTSAAAKARHNDENAEIKNLRNGQEHILSRVWASLFAVHVGASSGSIMCSNAFVFKKYST